MHGCSYWESSWVACNINKRCKTHFILAIIRNQGNKTVCFWFCFRSTSVLRKKTSDGPCSSHIEQDGCRPGCILIDQIWLKISVRLHFSIKSTSRHHVAAATHMTDDRVTASHLSTNNLIDFKCSSSIFSSDVLAVGTESVRDSSMCEF